MSGDIKVNRIKSRHQSELALLGDVIQTAQTMLPKLQETAKNRVERRNMMETLSALGAYTRANGFDPTRTLQHVANFDIEVWALVLEMFAKYEEVRDPVTGVVRSELRDDGLLYKFDESAGCLKLNKPFFFALLSFFESLNIPCDLRGKIKLT